MTNFAAYATGFEMHPQTGPAFQHLASLLGKLPRVDFALRVEDATVNQGQMTSDFDQALEQALCTAGAHVHDLKLPPAIPQELDFAFTFGGRTVAVEIEKANREKILRNILKCHMYLHAGADFALVVLARNYAHTRGVWDLFEFGVQRFNECQTYGFGTPDKLGRILLLSFTQFDAATGEPLSERTRKRMREEARRPLAT